MKQTTGYAVTSANHPAGPFFVTGDEAIFQIYYARKNAQDVVDMLTAKAKETGHPMTFDVMEVTITEKLPQKTLRLLVSRWTEPSDGSDTQLIDITDEEAARVQAVIDWLEKHAGGNFGHTLCSWELIPTKMTGGVDKVGVEEVLNWIALNSRYNETGTPGDYYEGQTHPDLDNRPT